MTHVDIIDAIASGDPSARRRSCGKHIQENIDAYMPSLRKRFGEGPVVDDGHRRGRNLSHGENVKQKTRNIIRRSVLLAAVSFAAQLGGVVVDTMLPRD